MKLPSPQLLASIVIVVAAAIAWFWRRGDDDRPKRPRLVAGAGVTLTLITGLMAILFDHQETAAESAQISSERMELLERAASAEQKSSALGIQLASTRSELTLKNEAIQRELDRSTADKAAAAAAVQKVQETLEAALREVATLRCDTDTCLVTFQDVFLFRTNEWALDCDKKENLSRLVGFLAFKLRLGINKIRIVGHADNVGTIEYNQELSERRAVAVEDYLTHAGIPRDIIVATGMGMSEPVSFSAPQSTDVVNSNNRTPEQRAKNRRVQIFLDKQ